MKNLVKWSITLGIILVLFSIMLWGTKLKSISSPGIETYKVGDKYYLSYKFVSDGMIKPKIRNISLFDNENKQIPYDNDSFNYKFYIKQDEKLDMAAENIKNGYVIKDKEFEVVLEIAFNKHINTDYVSHLKITYDILGISKRLEKKTSIVYDTKPSN